MKTSLSIKRINGRYVLHRGDQYITSADRAEDLNFDLDPLIAAAPELLQSLQYLLDMIDNAVFALSTEQEKERLLAHKAIAKAEGRQ